MIKNATAAETLLIQKTAAEYRKKGYEVSVEVSLDFLPGFRADLIAKRDDEARIVAVKSRSSLAAEPRIGELAQIVETKPGWSFELLLVGEPEKLDSPAGARPFIGDETKSRAVEAENSLRAGFPEAAFLLAWSACEAVIRALVEAEGVSNPSITRPGYVLDQAVYIGAISRDDYNYLTNLQRYRNAIVHGFTASGFDEEMVQGLIETVHRIAQNGSVSGDGSDQ